MKEVVKDHLRRDPPVSDMSIRHHRARRSCAGEIRSPRSFPSPDFFYTMTNRLSPLPPVSLLREILEYNPDTGGFTWLVSHVRARVGAEAGYINSRSYKCIRIKGRHYQAHRLAWLYVTGEAPYAHIDHIDGDPSNNKFANLRQATPGQNQHNSQIQRNNTSGVKGVSWDKKRKRWKAQIASGGVLRYLGLFRSIEDAAEVVREARCRMHGKFANHG